MQSVEKLNEKGQTACYNLASQEKAQTEIFSAGGADTSIHRERILLSLMALLA